MRPHPPVDENGIKNIRTCDPSAPLRVSHPPRPVPRLARLYDGVMVDGKPIPVTNVADKENVDAEEEDPNASED